MDYLLNGWLLYQAVPGCGQDQLFINLVGIWFRDQLQDTMNILPIPQASETNIN